MGATKRRNAPKPAFLTGVGAFSLGGVATRVATWRELPPAGDPAEGKQRVQGVGRVAPDGGHGRGTDVHRHLNAAVAEQSLNRARVLVERPERSGVGVAQRMLRQAPCGRPRAGMSPAPTEAGAPR